MLTKQRTFNRTNKPNQKTRSGWKGSKLSLMQGLAKDPGLTVALPSELSVGRSSFQPAGPSTGVNSWKYTALVKYLFIQFECIEYTQLSTG